MSVTEDHRFWSVTDDAWVELQDLDSDDQLLTPNGAMVTVDWLDWDAGVTAPAWDLTVDQEHNFFVAADGSAEPLLVHNNTPSLFCGVPVSADFATSLSRLNGVLADAGVADDAGGHLATLFSRLDEFEQEEFLGTLAALQQRVPGADELVLRSGRMIETAAVNPVWTSQLLEASGTSFKFELYLDQIARNGSDAGVDVVASARAGVPLRNPRDPARETNPTEIASATAEAGVSAYYQNLGRVVENMPDNVSDAVRDRIFVDIHGRRPPVVTKKPDLIVDGEFRDVYRPNPGVTPFSQALDTGLTNKLKDGQTQRLDIWLDGRTIEEAEVAFDEFLAVYNGDLNAFALEFSKNGRLPVEINVIESATGRSRVLYSAPDDVVVP